MHREGDPGSLPPELETAAAEADVSVRLRMVIARLSRRLERTRAGAALTSVETTVLATTIRRGPLGLSELARAEGMNPSMLSRVVRRLESSGLIVRQSDPEDRRAAVVTATASGRRLHERIRAERSDSLSAILTELSPAERTALYSGLPVLEKVAEHVKKRRA
ncbi:MAG: MarR family transcriptional regulator [Acidimicrobiales bacterium]|jgi:DNA-binding MarR family transcriptional regulator